MNNFKKSLLIAAVTLLFTFAALGSSSSGSSSSETKVSKITTQAPETQEGIKNTDEDSNASGGNPSENEQSDIADENQDSSISEQSNDVFYVGDTLATKKLNITYISSGEYVSDNQFIKPDEGKKYIFIELFCKNVSDSDVSITSYSFDCYADGYSCDSSYVGESVLSASLSSGRTALGKVYFEIPIDATEVEIEYEVDFWNSDKVKFIYEGNKNSGIELDDTVTESENAFKVGEIAETKDFRITYLSCGEHISDNMFIQPDEGYRFVYAEFEFENISDSDHSISSLNFDCFADGQSCHSSYSRNDSLSATLSPKRKTKGTVTFEVPINASVIEFEYEFNVWNSDRIIFAFEG